jgi:hypothetical protein
MMNRQDTFVAGASWACVKSKFPNLTFDRFWWTKLGLYDRHNQESRRFWSNHDLTERQAMQQLFGSAGSSSAMDDIEESDTIDFIFVRAS